MYRQYFESDWNRVKALDATGLGSRAISRKTGIPISTVRTWRKRDRRPASIRPSAPDTSKWGPEYAYLLGIYLGDGHLWQSSRYGFRLSIFCDGAYPSLIDEIKASIHALTPATTICTNRGAGRCIILSASSHIWPTAFPQHGPGRKHARPIMLEPWQREITHGHPEMLLRGLIHSDGCRCMNRFRTTLPSGRVAEYEYPRYFFSNLSADIKRIFCEHCDLLGIRWTQANPRYVSISHRDSVAKLDRFVGPKS
jgi:hypothetical protein